jgi:tRNA threonylcarbamoyladenosine biosynthesis protein TsaB
VSLVLAFDTATPHLAMVLSDAGRILASRVGTGDRTTHAERINILVQEVMEAGGHALQDLDAVAVGTGPGSYTGLRIGLSAAKGLCFALDIPLVGMSTLEVLCHQLVASGAPITPGDMLWPMVDARRMEVFTRSFSGGLAPLSEASPLVLESSAIPALGPRAIVFGDGADKAAALWAGATPIKHVIGIVPSVEGLARCATLSVEQGRFSDLAYLVPEYGKAANVAQPKRGKKTPDL